MVAVTSTDASEHHPSNGPFLWIHHSSKRKRSEIPLERKYRNSMLMPPLMYHVLMLWVLSQFHSRSRVHRIERCHALVPSVLIYWTVFFFSFFLRCSPRKSSSSAPHDWFSCKASQFGAKIMHFAYISFQIWSSMTSTRSHRRVFLLLPHEIAIAVFIIITFIRNDWNARNIFISSYTYIIWAEHWAGVCAPSYFTFLVLPDFFLVLPRYLFCSQIRNVSSICCAKN